MELRHGIAKALLMLGLVAVTLAPAHELHHHRGGHGASLETAGKPTVDELVEQFRRTGDDDYLDAAWAMLEPQLRSGVQEPGLLIDAATVAQSRHEFTRALELARRALELMPRSDQARLLLASIHLVRGETDGAARACRQLHEVALLVSLTCQARVAVARGEIEPARQRLVAVLEVFDDASASPEIFAWALSVAGDLSVSSHPADAVDFYQKSLEYTEWTQVRAALVDVLLAQGRLAEAGRVLGDGSDALPLAIRRLIVDRQLGRLGPNSVAVLQADRRFRRWIDKGDWLHAREMARFYLDVVDRPELATRLARINFAQQKEPEDLRLVQRTRSAADIVG